MAQYTLLMLELSGLQEFIFGTNNLRVNVGASTLVNAVIREWLPDLLPTPHNVADDGKAKEADIERDQLQVEAVYLGGGNGLLIFRDGNQANQFVREMSTKLLVEAPALKAVIEQVKIDWEKDVLVKRLKELREQLARRKQQVPANFLMPGLGVTAACVFTGHPATEEWREPNGQRKLVADSIVKRLAYFEYADQNLARLTPAVQQAGLKPVSNFNDFGTRGESSYLAIVHADGNRMGERLKELGRRYDCKEKNRAYANALRNFSNSAHDAAQEALRRTIHKLLACKATSEKGEEYWQRQRKMLPLDRERLPKVVLRRDHDGERLLPFRPIVFGGDDVTFVCDGRLGLALAQYYLSEYGKQNLADGQPAVGRAGVAIVHSHFPFAQGYALAETLVRTAKQQGENGHVASLDWHFGVNGIVEELSTIRQVSYQVPQGQLHARPLRLSGGSDWLRWETVEELIAEFQIGEKWRGRRNKLKALRTALRGGESHVEAFLENHRDDALPRSASLMNYANVEKKGWIGRQCVYFDPLEALDFYIPLEEPIS